MQPNDEEYSQPVAYDKDGRPLYAHPPQSSQAPSSQTPIQQVVHVSRAIDPVDPVLTPEAQRRHEDSVKKYPTLNLSKGEYIINEVRRHPIGLIIPVGAGGVLAALVLLGLASYPVLVPNNNPPFEAVLLPAVLMLVLIGLGTYIVTWVYLHNKFFLTNESVIQELQMSLFARNEQTVSLGNIEDASFTQNGLLPHLFNYGAIRLSTEGDETTYKFLYVSNPKKQIAVLNNAVEAFKNGRPVTGD